MAVLEGMLVPDNMPGAQSALHRLIDSIDTNATNDAERNEPEASPLA